MTAIQAVIFDMDGLLIDSEPLWALADLEVYGRLGINLSEHLQHETTGLRVDAAVLHWYTRFPWVGKSMDEVAAEIISKVDELLRRQIQTKPGAQELVKALASQNVPMAVCSSSPLALIETAMEAIGVSGLMSVLHSAEDEDHGKPHPAAYITTAKRLKANPQTILVFEDSLHGAIAAKAARMNVVAVPEGHNCGSSKFDFCDLILKSLVDFDVTWFTKHRTLPPVQKQLSSI